MKVSDYVADFLSAQGIHCVFEVVGGMVTHLIDSIYRQGRIRLVSTHHEQAAAFAAEGMARVTGLPGVALATSGPGAVNLLTGVGSCYFDSSPGLFITGQVNRSERAGDRRIRQLGFQETDIVSMARPVCKGAWSVDDPRDVPSILEEGFRLALMGRPGPVLIDIPMDVQRAQVGDRRPSPLSVPSPEEPDPRAVGEVLAALAAARRPLILAGGGIRCARVCDAFRLFAANVKVPVVHSLMATDVLPYNHPARVGMIGTYGNRWANLAIGRSDLLLVLGSRLDVRQTGSDTAAFKGDRAIYHVDCEPGEINNRVTGCHGILAHLQTFLAEAVRQSATMDFPDRQDWVAELARDRASMPDIAEFRSTQGINPNEFMHQLSDVARGASAFVVDVGQHQMWAAQSLELGPDQRFSTSGGMGAMGFSLPAAIGASMASRGKPVVVVAGDGSFQLNIQELQTVAHNSLPIKMIIINNQCYGMVRQFQQSYFEERYQSTYWGYSAPDFARIAHAYGIASHTVTAPSDVKASLEWLWRKPTEPSLVQVMVDTFANLYPKIAFGRPITEMEPFAKPVAMQAT